MNLKELSKVFSHALRHQPTLYNIILNEDGWVDLNSIISSVRTIDKRFSNLTVLDVEEMVNASEKKRHEIKDGYIRASYGHSLEKKILKNSTIPPKYLFHATIEESLANIFLKGLLPMQRQYVHLSQTKDVAIQSALRKTPSPVLLQIQAKDCYSEQGLKFYKETNGIWLADKITPFYLEILSI